MQNEECRMKNRLIRKLNRFLPKLPMLLIFGKMGNYISGFPNKSNEE